MDVRPHSRDILQRRAGDVVIVTHGPGRGRENPFVALFLDHLRRQRPDLHARVRLVQTGVRTPLDLTGADLVLFLLADPLQKLYPDCYREAEAIGHAARVQGVRILNPPEALSALSKSAQNRTWRTAGTPCAPSVTITDAADLQAKLEALTYPVILRYDLGHALESTFLCRSRAEADDAARRLRFPATALEFMDIRAEFQDAGDRSLFSRFHHKKRAFVFCGEVINSHLMFSPDPFVSVHSSTFALQARWKRRLAARFGYQRRLLFDTLAADLAYFEGPPDEPAVLTAAVRALGLDFVALDYSSRPDGGVALWEANPYFFFPHGSRSVMPKERQAIPRVEHTLSRFADTLSAVLDQASDARQVGLARASA